MSSRRQFIQSGTMAVGALAVGGSALLGVGGAYEGDRPRGSWSGAGPGSVRLYTVVYDDRFADSVAFAGQARAQGLRVRSLERGDVTSLWYDDLYHRWKQGPAGIGGLTTPEGLFVLETFGNDAGLRLRFKAEHGIEAGRVVHRLEGAPGLVAQAGLARCGADWNRRMAQLVSRCPGSAEERVASSEVSSWSAVGATEPQRLVSWVLAPVRRTA